MTRRPWAVTAWSIAIACLLVLSTDSMRAVQPAPTAYAAPASAPDNSIVLPLFKDGFSAPVFMTHAGDNSGRLFIVERSGIIKVIKNGDVLGTPFLDISALVREDGEQGLLGLAFHPNYENNGRFFVFYTAERSPSAVCNYTLPDISDCGNNTLAEFAVSGNPDVANPAPVRTLFSLLDRAPNHNGGMLAFSPMDSPAHLYVGTGDEGGGGDPFANAQNLNSLYGKMLRLDVDNIPSGQTYGIPPTNPFVGQGGVRPEIWAYGLRNPWRWSFDRQTGDLFIGDVGQQDWEEVDFMPSLLTGQSGRNYGWPIREGKHCYPPGTPSCTTAGLVDPILEYGHNVGCSITGGYRYRGSANPALSGIYLYGDACTGRIWKGIQSGGSWIDVEAFDGNLGFSSFAEDESGELYAVALAGSIFRIQQAGSPPVNCSDRPRVTVQTVRTGQGQLQVTITANTSTTVGSNQLERLTFTRIVNGTVTAGGQSSQTAPFVVNLPANTTTTQFTLQRQQAGAVHADLTVKDRCGDWKTFAGGGTSMP